MSGDDLSPATDDHLVHVALYQYVAVPVGHRHRVVVGPVSDQREGTHPARLLLTGVVGHRGQRHQCFQVPLHTMPDGLGVAPQPGVHPLQTTPLQEGVQGIKALEGRDGHEEVAPHIADQALNLAFVVALAGTPEPVLEQVVGLKLGKGAGALATPIP